MIGRTEGNETSEIKAISVARFDYNVSVSWQTTDVQEIYQVFRSGQSLLFFCHCRICLLYHPQNSARIPLVQFRESGLGCM